jgi:hypothetical protein
LFLQNKARNTVPRQQNSIFRSVIYALENVARDLLASGPDVWLEKPESFYPAIRSLGEAKEKESQILPSYKSLLISSV